MGWSTRASMIVIASLVFWIEVVESRAQQEPSKPAGASVPAPRPWPSDDASGAQTQPRPTEGPPISPAVGPPVAQGTGTLPVPLVPAPQPRTRSVSEEQFVTLKPAPLEPTDLKFPINLATALRLADARPLMVAAAQASVWVAEAQLTRTKVLWVPQLNLGADYIRHDGGGPDFNKGIMTAPSVNFFYGGGGLTQNVALTDVYFQPLAARQVLNSRQLDIQTAKNDALLQTAFAYFMVHQHRGMFAGASIRSSAATT